MYKQRRKLLSQNFLFDRELIKRLIGNSSIGKTDTVLEIGPGKGIITQELISNAGKVIAIELDSSLFTELNIQFNDQSNLELYNADFLRFPLPHGQYKVFSNIPFRFTGEIIKKLLFSFNPPQDTYLIVQKEAAEKYLGNSLIAALLHPWFEFSIQYRFGRCDFIPATGVSSVLLRIGRRNRPLLNPSLRRDYEDFLTYVFSGKKPQLLRLSKKLSLIHISEWLCIFKIFINSVNRKKLQNAKGTFIKLMSEQSRLQKIHRTREDKNWKRFK